MEHPPERWTLADLVDFEVLLKEREGTEVSRREREAVEAALAGAGRKSRGEAVRRGFRAWLEVRRVQLGEESGERIALALRFTAFLAAVVGFLAGTSVMRGMLHLTSEGRSFHLWIFLAVTIGLQLLILVFTVAVYFVMRGKRPRVGIMGEVLGGVARRFTRKKSHEVWKSVLGSPGGAQSVLGWRLTTLSQGMGISFNVGLLAGLLGCLWVFEVFFYWDTTFRALVPGQLFAVAEFLAWPWSWSGIAPAPSREEVKDFSLLSGHFQLTEEGRRQWTAFLFMAIAVWGLLPRVILWMVAKRGEARILSSLAFQERRHRELWRQLIRDESEERFEGPSDGVVVVNVGGIEIDEEALRGYLLRRLRVHADALFNAEVLDGSGEESAFEAIRSAPLGVIFLVEGWALSPKQVRALYGRVREIDKERAVRFLVLGDLTDGHPVAPSEDDLAQWEAFGDSLRDPAVVVSPFRTETAAGEGS